MRKKAIIISENLMELEKGETVLIIPKNAKILGATVKSIYDMSTEDIAVIKEDDKLKKDIKIFIIKDSDIRMRK